MTEAASAEKSADAGPPASLVPLSFNDLPGWAADDHGAALAALRLSAAVRDIHPPKARGLGLDPDAIGAVLARVADLPPSTDGAAARRFFEAAFIPHEVVPTVGGGFLTGYYEPVVEGSRVRTARFTVPLYRPPEDLVELDRPVPGINPSFRFARRTGDGYEIHPDRGAIDGGYLRGRGLELVWLADPIDAFFIHIQGAARIAFGDGTTMRVTYAAKTGHPYTPIGRVLIENGALPKGGATMQTIRAWLADHPGEAAGIMAENRSFIFFREAPVDDPTLGPVAAAKVPLSAGRSLAVDRILHSFHVPIWVDTTLPGGNPMRRLMVAQDTGSAIVGPARGDIFFGSGDAAGAIAGAMRAAARFVVLVPRAG